MALLPPPETRQFNRDAQGLVKFNAPQARALKFFIYQNLCRFGLQGHITEWDVFIEAYLRGVQYTRRGRSIRHSSAWLRKTAYNIIREWQRDQAKYCDTALDDLLEKGIVGYHENLPSEDKDRYCYRVETETEKVRRAFSNLDDCDRSLLHWKIIETLSWQSIHERLMAQGQPAVPLPTLRKRGQRALERLRRNYHQQQ
jgi:DNA-directed RNA polymerase specialized sigma24 family protein